MNFYDREMKEAIASLPESDQLAVLESLFNGMVASMRAYYTQLGHTKLEINTLLEHEVAGVKQLIANRISEIPEEIDPEKLEETDDQFDSDIAIELGLILLEFGVKDQ